MPSVSSAQQRLFGLVRAAQKGDIPLSQLTGKARDMVHRIKPRDTAEFAATKHTGLPNRIADVKDADQVNYKSSSQLHAALLLSKLASIDAAIRKTEQAVRGVGQKHRQNLSKMVQTLNKENQKLKAEVQKGQAEKAQVQQSQAQATPQAAPQLPPAPTAQPPFGAMLAGMMGNNQQNKQTPAAAPKLPGASMGA